MTKANDTGGNGMVDVAFNWTLTISNTDAGDATFNAGQRILEDDLPAGPTYGAPAPGNFTNITNTANISCTIAANALTCDAQPGSVTIGATTGSFDIVLSVTPNAAGILNNPRGVGTCRVDPNGNMVESDESNNDCPANSVAVTPREVYLPLVWKGFVYAPDLVEDSLVATSNAVMVTIRNQGNAPVVDAFWVDVYFNPNVVPGLNQECTPSLVTGSCGVSPPTFHPAASWS